MAIVYFIIGILALKGVITMLGEALTYWEQKGLIKKKESR